MGWEGRDKRGSAVQQCRIYMGVFGDALVVLGKWIRLSLWDPRDDC